MADHISSKTVRITPYNMYLHLVNNIYDGIRANAAGKEYLSSDFGGLRGQLDTLAEPTVIQVYDIDVGE